MFGRDTGIAALGAAIVWGLSMPGAATAQPNDPLPLKGCTVNAAVTMTVPSGTTLKLPNGKQITCYDGDWIVTVDARTAHIDAITIHEDNMVTFDNATFYGPADISMSEFATIAGDLFNAESGPVDRAVVAVDDRTELTDEQLARILEDPSAGVVRVLAVVDSPDPAITFEDLGAAAGEVQPVRVLARNTVVMFLGKLVKKVVTHVRCSSVCKVTLKLTENP